MIVAPYTDADPRPNTVRFATTTEADLYAWGRNGGVKQSGVHVSTWGGKDHVALFPVNSKGNVSGAARLLLPVTAIPELVEILLGFYAGPLGALALNPPKNPPT